MFKTYNFTTSDCPANNITSVRQNGNIPEGATSSVVIPKGTDCTINVIFEISHRNTENIIFSLTFPTDMHFSFNCLWVLFKQMIIFC